MKIKTKEIESVFIKGIRKCVFIFSTVKKGYSVVFRNLP